MNDLRKKLSVEDGDEVLVGHIPLALTTGAFIYDDGATQTFDADAMTER
jgi:hypothetical protein